jgi:hypothetical protein
MLKAMIGGVAALAAISLTPTPAAHAGTICGFWNGGQVEAIGPTSCPFAMNVARAYGASGGNTVMAASPVTGEYYRMWCMAGGGAITCRGGDDAVVVLH